MGEGGAERRPSDGRRGPRPSVSLGQRLEPGRSALTPSQRETAMNRREFEALRDIPGKVIRGDIRFVARQAITPAVVAENIEILNDHQVELRLTIHVNPEIGSKTFNVHVPGKGPICRLDVDGTAHRPAGRSHEHSLQSERCPDRNLADGVDDRPELSGKSLTELFGVFCAMAKISHDGLLVPPKEDP